MRRCQTFTRSVVARCANDRSVDEEDERAEEGTWRYDIDHFTVSGVQDVLYNRFDHNLLRVQVCPALSIYLRCEKSMHKGG